MSTDCSLIVDPLSCFLFQPMLHNWCNKDLGMYYPVCGMVHIKDNLLLIRKSSLWRGSSRFPLAEWSFTTWLMSDNFKNMMSASFPSFLELNLNYLILLYGRGIQACFNELFVSFYFSGTFITVVLLGPCTHAVSTLCHLLDILEKVWRIKNANKTRSVSY